MIELNTSKRKVNVIKTLQKKLQDILLYYVNWDIQTDLGCGDLDIAHMEDGCHISLAVLLHTKKVS